MDCGDVAAARRQDYDDEPEPCWMKEQRRVELLAQDERLRDKKLIADTIRRKVELGMEAYEEDLEERRDRLRELLLRDETQLTRELIRKVREDEEERAKELMAKLEEAEKQKKCARETLLKRKQMQLVEETSQAIREARAKAWTEDAKKANLAQMAENQRQRWQDREREAFWHEQLLERCRVEACAEERKASGRQAAERRRAEILRRQMQAKSPSKEAVEQQPDYANEGACVLPRGSEALVREKQRRQREDLDRQLAEERRRAEELAALERASADDDKGLLREERSRDDEADKEARRAEVLAFMRSMREFRDAVARRETEAEECVRRLAADAEARRREERLRAKEERARSGRELRLAWDRQREERRQRQLRQQQLDQDNCELAAEVMQEEKEKRAQRHRAAIEYGRELLAQQNSWEESRAREQRSLDEHYELQRIERVREEQRLARELAFGSRLRISGCP